MNRSTGVHTSESTLPQGRGIRLRVTVMVTLVLLAAAGLAAQEGGAQEASSVRIQPFEARGGTEAGSQLANTVEQTIRLSLRLIEGITVLSPEADEEETVEISGLVTVGGGEYVIDLAVRDQRIPGEVQELTVSTDSLLEVFDLADQLTEEAVRQITRRDIDFGSLTLVPGGVGAWQVVLGGERFPDSPRSFNRLPAGTYTISIEQQQGGEPAVVHEEEITVESGETTRVAFELPDPTLVARSVISRSESDYIGSYLYGTATPISAVLERAGAAATEAQLSELYDLRLELWSPTGRNEEGNETGSLTARLNQGRFLLNSLFQGNVEGSPSATDVVAEVLTVFDTQLAAWAEEQSSP